MSEDNINSTKSMVIDASVARAAGETDHPISRQSRDFLEAFFKGKHRFVVSDDLLAEWKKHQSGLALAWRRRMVQHGRVIYIGNVQNAELRSAVQTSTQDISRIQPMLKDVHLVETALVTDDRIVVSKDDKIRNHFCSVLNRVEVFKCILWVNPTNETEKALEWIENGANLEEERRLENWLAK